MSSFADCVEQSTFRKRIVVFHFDVFDHAAYFVHCLHSSVGALCQPTLAHDRIEHTGSVFLLRMDFGTHFCRSTRRERTDGRRFGGVRVRRSPFARGAVARLGVIVKVTKGNQNKKHHLVFLCECVRHEWCWPASETHAARARCATRSRRWWRTHGAVVARAAAIRRRRRRGSCGVPRVRNTWRCFRLTTISMGARSATTMR
jgi:hypothetical protein